MDVETTEALERIDRRFDQVDDRFDQVDSRFETLETSLRAEIQAFRAEIRAELREGLEERRRHTEVLYESLRDDIRMLAEGFAMMSAKLDSLQR
jgi:chaperonin cofactor prefoldin